MSNLNALYTELEWHDWYYCMSDDHRVYMSGKLHADKIHNMAIDTEAGRELLKAYADYIFKGYPKPTKPT